MQDSVDGFVAVEAKLQKIMESIIYLSNMGKMVRLRKLLFRKISIARNDGDRKFIEQTGKQGTRYTDGNYLGQEFYQIVHFDENVTTKEGYYRRIPKFEGVFK